MTSGDVEMTSLVRQTWHELAQNATGRDVRFRVRELPPIRADRALMKQVFANLLGNAIKYTFPKDPAEIEVDGEETATEHIYRVRNNGIGFDMKYAHRIFDVFVRLQPSDEFEGTGIGLATVRLIVERHGGRIWAESNRGAAPPSPSPSPQDGSSPDGRGSRSQSPRSSRASSRRVGG